MEAFDGFRQAFIVFSQAAKATDPREGAFDDPPLGQQHEALLGFLHFDQVQLDLMLGRFFLGFLSAVTAIHKSHLHVLSGDFLHRIAQRLDLRAVAFISRCHAQRQKMPQRVYGDVNLGAFAALYERLIPPDARFLVCFAKCASRR